MKNKSKLMAEIEHYKLILDEIEKLTAQKDSVRRAILKRVDGVPGTYGDLTITSYQPSPSLDSKALLEDLELEPSYLAKFYKERAPIVKFLFKRALNFSSLYA